MKVLDGKVLSDMMTPLSPENPCGENMEYDELYMSLDDFALGIPSSEMGDSVVEGKDPDYRKLYDSCLKLWEKTRDLRVGCFFSLSSLCLYGIEGLCQGLTLIDYLVREQFEGLYPQLDPDDDNDPTERINILAMLSPAEGGYSDPYNFITHLRQVKLVSELPYTFRDYLIGSGFLDGTSTDTDINSLNSQMMAVPVSEIRSCYETITTMISLTDSICNTFNSKIGDTGYLVMDSLKHELGSLKNFYQNYLSSSDNPEKDKDLLSENEPLKATSVDISQSSSEHPVKPVFTIDSFVPSDRKEALLLLKKSAEYFQKAEPTSPGPFLINRALRMANMNFIDLLGEIDSNALDRGREQLGVKTEQDQ